MELFSRKAKVPPPQIAIFLDHPGPYAPGSIVSGSVSVQTEVPRHIRSVSVACLGKVTTHNVRRVQRAQNATNNGPQRRTIHYHDEAILFRLDQGLFASTETIPEKALSSQFSFTIPWGTEEVVGHGPYSGGWTNLEAYITRSHALPPTFAHFRDGDHYANVDYGMQVTISFADGLEPYHSPVQGFVLVSPPNHARSEVRFLETAMPSQKYSSSRLTGNEKSIMNSFKDKFSSSTPSVGITLKAKVASILLTGSTFSVQTCAEIDSFSVDGISIPVVELRIRNLKLIPVTFYRALRMESWRSSRLDRGEHEMIDEKNMLLNANPGSHIVQKQHVEKSQNLVFPATFESRIPSSVCPSFRTLNINRTYRLKMVLEAEVCGKVFEHKFELNVAVDAPSRS